MQVFERTDLKNLYRPPDKSSGEDNGQVTIIGGSSLFHGAPLLSLKVASRIVDMVFFASPDPSVGRIAELIKSNLMSFIWVPWEDIDSYIEKSDAVLIGPGFMRFSSEQSAKHIEHSKSYDEEGEKTRKVTEHLLKKFPNKHWVIDAGSLQTMDPTWIPENAVLTPNFKEFQLLFNERVEEHESRRVEVVSKYAKRYNCIIVLKGPEIVVASPENCMIVKGGNPGMTKGGTGDVLAGLTVALLAKNDPFLAATAASFIAKAAADDLYLKVGTSYNADDLADRIPETLQEETS